MNNTTTKDKTLTTADFAAAASDRREQEREVRHEGQQATPEMREREMRREGQPATAEMRSAAESQRQRDERQREHAPGRSDEQLAPLFLPQMAEQFRARWDEVQIGFVDDPAQAVRKADELVAQVMKNLAETFSHERANFEGQMDQGDTENMRVALRRYRSFFQRLLSL